jgi:hypothetical protein
MCCQNIAENIHKFGIQYKAPFWQITRAVSERAFDIAVQVLQRDALQVKEYIQWVDKSLRALAILPQNSTS